MKIFVPHYFKLTDRKESIIRQFEKHGIKDYEFVECFNPETLTRQDIIRFNLVSVGQLSLALKHFYIYEQIAEKHERALIFEDDVILADDFSEKFEKYIKETPDDADMLFIGDGCNLHIEKDKIIPSVHIYKKCLDPTDWGGDGATRTTDSYMITQKCARTLTTYINGIKDPITKHIDWWLNKAARDNNFIVYWAEPTIVTQGSQNGTFKRSI